MATRLGAAEITAFGATFLAEEESVNNDFWFHNTNHGC